MASSLKTNGKHAEAASFLRETIPKARQELTENSDVLFKLEWLYAQALYEPTNASREEYVEAAREYEKLARKAVRVYGTHHPTTKHVQRELANAHAALAEVVAAA